MPVTLSPIRIGTEKVTESQRERLNILIEEAAEVTQAACKILRFGYESKNPFLEGAITNREELEKEIGDFRNIVEMMIAEKDIREAKIEIAKAVKAETISYWLTMQKKK